jgi:hypothetical protein
VDEHHDDVGDESSVEAVIAVPDDAVDELIEDGLVEEMLASRGPIVEAVIEVGVDSAALVTIIQATDSIRRFAAWLIGRARARGDSVIVTGNRSGRQVELRVTGDAPIDAVSNFLSTVFRDRLDDNPTDSQGSR